MSVLYRKYQNNNDSSKAYGKWYGRAVILNTVSTDELSDEVAAATTVTPADVRAVLKGMAMFIKTHLQTSQGVHLEGLGTFRVGLVTSPAKKMEDFSATNIARFRILYAPEVHFVASGVNKKGNRTGVFVKDLLEGITAKEAPRNIFGKETKKKSDSTTTGGDNSSTGGDGNSTQTPSVEPGN